jgi:hypothetical protein
METKEITTFLNKRIIRLNCILFKNSDIKLIKNKMKNNIISKTALKTICSLIIVVLLGFNNYTKAQVQNVPEGLHTLGRILDPIEMGPDFNWTFINETGCEITLAHWQVFDSTNQHVKNGIVIPAADAVGNVGTVTIAQSAYLALFGITPPANLTHTYFQISVGAGYQFEANPFTNSAKVMTGQPIPCDCFIWVADFINKTYRITKCH